MDTTVLDTIPFQLDLASLMATLRIKAQTQRANELERLVQIAHSIGKPKAIYKVAYIESKSQASVNADGAVYTSRVLRVNVEKAHKVFPFIVTCGMELHEWAASMDDLVHRFWADAIGEMALRSATEFLEKHLVEQYEFTQLAMMNPGSLEDWPLSEQRVLFAQLGNPQAAIGVRLTNSLVMVPAKSISGIWFPTQESFASCQLCPRENCRGRRAPYDKDLYDRKYRASALTAA